MSQSCSLAGGDLAEARNSQSAEPGSDFDAAQCLVLRESLKMRCNQTAPAAALVLIGVCVVFVSLLREMSAVNALMWLGPVLSGMGLRLAVTRRIRAQLDEMTPQAMQAADFQLRLSSVANQFIVGAGVWSLGTAGSADAELLITIIIAIWAVGAMINLSSDYGTFRASLPFLLIQPIAYWSMQGLNGLPIAVSVAILGTLMLLVVKQSSKSFADRVTINLEKDELLAKVQAAHVDTERALATAEEANRSKTAFLAAASHDLRQPLFAISILAETLLMHELPESAKAILDKQLLAIGILRSLFDNLLDLSKFEVGRVQAACRPIRLSEVLEPLNAEFGSLCEAKKLSWRFSAQELSVVTDPELLGRMLGNLLANAVRYTDKGQVSLLVTAEGGRARIVVADSGSGIAPSDREKIFQDFVQLANTHRDREHGVGLGLAIVRRIDRLLGTGLSMESEVGSGTQFSLWLPVAENAVMGASEAASPGVADRLPANLKVWLVEDDLIVRSALVMQFDAWGCQSRALGSSKELLALRKTQGEWPDAVILDDMLGPQDSGLEIAGWLSGQMPIDHILIVTGNVEAERIAALLASGITVMRKPLASDELRRWLQSVAPSTHAVS